MCSGNAQPLQHLVSTTDAHAYNVITCQQILLYSPVWLLALFTHAGRQVQEKVSQDGTLSVESTVAVPSPKIDIPDASSKIYAIVTECVEESDGHLHIFIPSTDSEKGSSRDSMAAESLDDWKYFDGGGSNDPLEVTSISSDIPKEVANSHENASRLFCSADSSTPEGIVIKPNTSQHQDSDVPDKLDTFTF
ncbi:uncharacterized protein LOC119589580 [Penaeus monodon]|uniref:uncharacterized protein LOC119589580 n=1 Tax=Penaeus monodon TaxID=6687 RepID=UPI0018A70179|nr:uncharacterized protein LOC119589580 [Penaeus monodon]